MSLKDLWDEAVNGVGNFAQNTAGVVGQVASGVVGGTEAAVGGLMSAGGTLATYADPTMDGMSVGDRFKSASDVIHQAVPFTAPSAQPDWGADLLTNDTSKAIGGFAKGFGEQVPIQLAIGAAGLLSGGTAVPELEAADFAGTAGAAGAEALAGEAAPSAIQAYMGTAGNIAKNAVGFGTGQAIQTANNTGDLNEALKSGEQGAIFGAITGGVPEFNPVGDANITGSFENPTNILEKAANVGSDIVNSVPRRLVSAGAGYGAAKAAGMDNSTASQIALFSGLGSGERSDTGTSIADKVTGAPTHDSLLSDFNAKLDQIAPTPEVKPPVLSSTPEVAPVSAETAQTEPVQRPASQAQIEDLINKGDVAGASKIVEGLPEGDPYKSSMQSLMKSMAPEDTESVPRPVAQESAPVSQPTDIPAGPEITPGRKERAFVTAARASEDTEAGVRPKIEGEYDVQTHVDTKEQAAKLMENPEVAKQRAAEGTDAISIETSYQLARKAQEEAKALDASGDIDGAEAKRDEAAGYLNKTAENLTTHGQAVEAAKLWAHTPEGQARLLATDINEYNKEHPDKPLPKLSGAEASQIIERQRAIDNMPETTTDQIISKGLLQKKLYEDMADRVPRHSFLDKLLALRRGGLLTGLKTVGKVAIGNLLHVATESTSHAIATGLDTAIAGFGGERSISMTGDGIGKGLDEGRKIAVARALHGYEPDATYESIKSRRINWGDSPLGKFAEAYTDIPGRIHGALGDPAAMAVYHNSLNDQANVAWMNEATKAEKAGTPAPDQKEFVKDFVENPPKKNADIAREESLRMGFNNKTTAGDIATKLTKGGEEEGNAAMRFLIPFTQKPAAIATEVANYTPVGAVGTLFRAMKAMKGPEGWTPEIQRDFVKGIGRSITGTGLIAMGATLAGSGIISLGYPPDQKTRDQWALEGKTENSILLGGKWRSLGSLGPAGGALSIGAYFQNGMDGTDKKPGDWVQAAVGAATGGLATQADQPYLSGISTVADAIKDPERNALSVAKSSIDSFVPTFVSNAASAGDPYQRETKTIPQSLESKIPGLRETLPEKLDTFGSPLENSGTALEKMADPTMPSYASTDPTVQFLSQLAATGYSATPGAPSGTVSINGKLVKLTQDQIDAMQAAEGPEIKAAYSQLVNNPDFQNADPLTQQTMLQAAVTKIRAAGTAQAKQDVMASGQYDATPGLAKTASVTSGTTTGKSSGIKITKPKSSGGSKIHVAKPHAAKPAKPKKLKAGKGTKMGEAKADKPIVLKLGKTVQPKTKSIKLKVA